MEIEPRSIWNIYCMFEWCVRLPGCLSVFAIARLSAKIFIHIHTHMHIRVPNTNQWSTQPPKQTLKYENAIKKSIEYANTKCVSVCLSVDASVCLQWVSFLPSVILIVVTN